MKHTSRLFGPITEDGPCPVVAVVLMGQQVTKTALKILGIKQEDGDVAPGTLIGDNNLPAARQAFAASPSQKITNALVSVIFPEGPLKFDAHSDEWVNEK